MKEIILTRGQVAIVDDDDFERVNALHWSAKWSKPGRAFYARTNIGHGVGNQRTVELQRFIMGDPIGVQVDHRNGNTLDCRKENLRLATHSENSCNRRKQGSGPSRFKGVYIKKRTTKEGLQIRYHAHIEKDGKQKDVGPFVTEDMAALAYDAAARALFGPFARLNFPNPGEVGAL